MLRQQQPVLIDENAFRETYSMVNAVVDALACDALKTAARLAATDASETLDMVASQARYLIQSANAVSSERPERDTSLGRELPTPFRLATYRAAAITPRSKSILEDPFFDLMERWQDGLADFLAGDRTGVEILFPRNDLGPWSALHADSRVMGHYAKLAAHLVAGLADRGAALLEVGGGTGAGLRHVNAFGVLHRLAKYHFTDVSPSFQTVPDDLGIAGVSSGVFDVDKVPWDQGFTAESFDLILCVNALHVAQDVNRSLRYLNWLLKPGGCLILGEGMPPADGRIWRPDLLFAMLPGWWNVKTDREFRPRCGFLTAGEWARLLRCNGFSFDEVQAARAFREDWYGGALWTAKESSS